MTRPPGGPVRDGDPAALLHALQVHQAELELQNLELIATNDELRRSNAALEFARDRYRALHDLAPTPLVTLDPRGTILDVNAAAEAALRTPRRRLIDRRFALFVADGGAAALHELLRDLFSGGFVRGAEMVLTADGGVAVDALLDAVLIRDHADGLSRAVVAFVDITERKRAAADQRAAELRAEEARRLESLGVLAGGIAHDFNNLLTVVLAGTQHVLRALGPGAPLAPPLLEVLAAVRQAGALAHQMLAYSGRVSAPARAIDLGLLVRQLEPLVRASTRTVGVALSLPRALPWVQGDEAQLRQVVLNLVINAAEAMHDRPGAITIVSRAETLSAPRISSGRGAGALPPGAYVVLEIRDDGVGMDAATQARIFEPYFSTKFVGRGLGLAVVQGIVRAHGGALEVDSELGRGTTFRVYLPAVPAGTSAADRSSAEPAAWRCAGTVLLVDDELHVRNAVARMLEGFGLAVLTAEDGAAAVEVFRAERARIDLVLMDLTMPRMNGVAAGIAIHALRAETPIVLVTGYGVIPPAAGSAFAAVLAKPFDLDRMRAVLQQLLPATPTS